MSASDGDHHPKRTLDVIQQQGKGGSVLQYCFMIVSVFLLLTSSSYGQGALSDDLVLSLKKQAERFVIKNGYLNEIFVDKTGKLLGELGEIKPLAVGYDFFPGTSAEVASITVFFEYANILQAGFRCMSMNLNGSEKKMSLVPCHGRSIKKFPLIK